MPVREIGTIVKTYLNITKIIKKEYRIGANFENK